MLLSPHTFASNNRIFNPNNSMITAFSESLEPSSSESEMYFGSFCSTPSCPDHALPC
jgi:hypothetical protein